MESIDDRNPLGWLPDDDCADVGTVEFVSQVLLEENSEDRYVDCLNDWTGSSSSSDDDDDDACSSLLPSLLPKNRLLDIVQAAYNATKDGDGTTDTNRKIPQEKLLPLETSLLFPPNCTYGSSFFFAVDVLESVRFHWRASCEGTTARHKGPEATGNDAQRETKPNRETPYGIAGHPDTTVWCRAPANAYRH